MIHTNFLLLKRAMWRRILAMFSLSTAAFAFQACNGVETDLMYDVQISGHVTALDSGKPIEGISVRIKDYYPECLTDSLGGFTLYAPSDTAYILIFEDIDSSLHGSFVSTKMRVENGSSSYMLQADMALSRINN